ncbi:MAG TPA: tripartite tricarboxylate transporter substrate-binding protein, partial [Burkholderiales bacterium]|nr:tripartite tricarboxylate transporter substrate-binding protein [Burkholderiales bacterium]
MKATAIRSFSVMVIMAGMATAACAQAPYPNKPIRFIVAYVAGGANDVLARIVGQKLSEAWKQPVVIENKPGAAGLIGADFVAKSPPDGYTLLSFSSGHAIASSLYSKPPFDARTAFAPITLVASMPLVLVVHPSLP